MSCYCNISRTSCGQGQVKPLEAKVNAISEFPVPKCKRQLIRFLGMAGYYRKFCKNFSGIAEPLTNLLKKSTKFKWNDKCQDAFDRLKAILKSAPVLLAPDFDKCFKLAVDASDVGIGAVLLQEDNNGIDHPVCYFSKKFNKTSEKLLYHRKRVSCFNSGNPAVRSLFNLFNFTNCCIQ